jgi:hypothetical protein
VCMGVVGVGGGIKQGMNNKNTAFFSDSSTEPMFGLTQFWAAVSLLAVWGCPRKGGGHPCWFCVRCKAVATHTMLCPISSCCRVCCPQLLLLLPAATECFNKAGAVVVPRTRFAPVKTTSDSSVLLLLPLLPYMRACSY